MRSRALRRHHEEKLKRRVGEYYGGAHKDETSRIGLIAHSRKPCSCWVCGNPRKYFNEPTTRERRQHEDV